MGFDEMYAAVNEAKQTISTADNMVAKMASLIAGRLRKGNVPQYVLRQLKNELRKYNPHTGTWRD